MKKPCLFCGGRGRTREHVWAQWLSAILPGFGAFTVTHETDTPEVLPLRWSSRSLDLTVKKFCSACNNRWLSQLEGEARPILTPMVQGQPVVLSPMDQVLVAAWAFKNALVFTLTNRSPAKYFTSNDYHEFWRTREPTPGTYTWLAAYDAIQWTSRYRDRFLHVTRPSGSESRDGHSMMLAIGRLVIVQFCSRWTDPMTFDAPTNFARFLVPVWPAIGTGRTWPPPDILNHSHLDLLAEVFTSRPEVPGRTPDN